MKIKPSLGTLLLAVVLLIGAMPKSSDAVPRHKGGESGERAIADESILKCDFLKRSDRKRLLPNSGWALDASGARFLRGHPALTKPEVKKRLEETRLGIIDNGFAIYDNPDAGSGLVEDTRGAAKRTSRHGTHVAGIIASEKFGVYPGIRVKPFPVTYTGSEQDNFMIVGGGFDHTELMAQLRAAAKKDSGVGVINLSISADDDPALGALVKEALYNGKIVIYAAGNSGNINDRGNAGHADFMQYPNFFTVGALGYFGTPASLASYGDNVPFFVPGADVDSLSSRFNPNLIDSQRSDAFSGSSMAAPHFSAIIHLLKSLAPDLSGEDLRLALKLSSIARKGPPDYLQPTAYKAVELMAKTLELKKSGPYGDALKRADEALRTKAAAELKTLKAPEGKECGKWEKYFDALEKVFFLTNGELGGDLIVDALPNADSLAESYYFSPPGALKARLGEPKPVEREGLYDRIDEKEYAKRYAAGHQNPIRGSDDRKALVRTNLRRYLSLLPATKTNIPLFLEQCSDWLETEGNKNEDCKDFLRNSPYDFLREVGKAYDGKGKFGRVIPADQLLLLARNDDDRALARRLLDDAASKWIYRPDDRDDFTSLVLLRNWKDLSEKARKLVTEQLMPAPGAGSIGYDQAKLLARLPSEKTKPFEKALVAKLTPEKKSPAVGKFVLASWRAAAGNLPPAEFKTAFDKFLQAAKKTDPKELSDLYMEYGDNHFLTRALVPAIETNSKFADAVIESLSKPGMLTLWQSIGELGTVVQALFEKASKLAAEKLLAVLVRDIKKTSDHFGGGLYYLLSSNEKNPLVAAYFAKLVEGPARDNADEQALRLARLKEHTANATVFDDNVRKYIAEGPKGKALLEVPALLLGRTPELRKQLTAAINAAAADKNSYGYELASYVAIGGKEAFLDLEPLIRPHLATLLKASKLDDYSSREFDPLSAYIAYAGRDKTRINTAGDALKGFLSDDAIMSQTTGEGGNFRSRASQVAMAYQLLARSHAGKAYVEANPKLAEPLAKAIFRVIEGNDKASIFDFHMAVPAPLQKELFKNLPLKEKLKDRAPEWLEDFFYHGTEQLAISVPYIASLPAGRPRDELVWAIARMVRDNPDMKSKVLAVPDLPDDLRKSIKEEL